MKLESLNLENFKGVKRFELNTEGNDIDVYGANGAGKTTLADAYFWLLFGKDSTGRSDSNFDIIPLGASGLDCSVRGVFRKETGEEFSLRRVYKQKFERKNGEAERKNKGNTTDFYIDDVPKPKKDYTAFVSGICDEATLMLFTDPDRFPGKMRWDERREMLIRLFATQTSDRKIIEAHKELAPLMNLIGLKSVSDYAAISRERRKVINRELSDIPGRIDEAEKAKPAEAVPLPIDGPRLGQLIVEKSKLEDEISSLRSGESVATMRKEIAEIEAEIARTGADYTRKTLTMTTSPELTAAKQERMQLSSAISERAFKLDAMALQIAAREKKLDELRKACIDNFNMEFDSTSGICPTCGREYLEPQIESMCAAWNEQKADRQEQLETQGRETRAELDRMIHESEVLQIEQDEAQKRQQKVEATIRAIEKAIQQPPAWETTPQYESLVTNLSEKRCRLDELQRSIDINISRCREKLTTVEAEISEINTRQVNKGIIDQQNARIRQLMAEEKKLALELAEIDNGLRLADEFVQAQATDIEDSVNNAFRMVRWKLFDRQINGGIKACCEATVNGVEYGTNLNSAARLNAGLDIISALSGKMGVSFPIWIDNAESVTDYLPVQSQVIRLFVSAEDKQLRTEVRE